MLAPSWATVCKTVRPMLSDRCPVCLSVLSVTLVHCGQTVGRIKMKLCMQVGLGPGQIVLDGDPAPPPQRGTAPNFRPMSVAAKWLHGSRWHLAWRWSLSRPHCASWGPITPPPKGGRAVSIFVHFYCGQTAGCMKMPLGMEAGLSPGDCVRWGPHKPQPPEKGTPTPPNFCPMSIVVTVAHLSYC